MGELEEAICNVRRIAKKQGLDYTKGLPEELFIFGTTLMPVVNIDILAMNEKGEVLLTWRDDQFYGKGWHIPGGCIRIKETIAERVRKVAIEEIGTEVSFDMNNMIVRESMVNSSRPWLEDELERSHNISLLFPAKVPENFIIDNRNKTEHEVGYARWFNHAPVDLLKAHKNLYGDILEKYLGGNEK